MITAAIWLAAVAVYGLYCQNPMQLPLDGPRNSDERFRRVTVTLGVLAIPAAATLATIAVNGGQP